MSTPRTPQDLTGHLLIAMPGLGDPRFDRAVILLCAHSERGSMGLIVNKPAPDLDFARLIDQLSIPAGPGACPVQFGGPMESGRGFVLHSPPESGPGVMEIPPGFGMTSTPGILRRIARGGGPRHALLALGYAGWGPGQIEDELRRNDWLVAPATQELVFAGDNSTKWTRAMRTLGIEPHTLSATGGRA